MIDMMKRKLSAWKRRHLSFGGRISLILSSISIYFLSFFIAPKKVIFILNHIQRNFLWRAKGEEKRVPWVSWDIVYSPKEKGGLGIKNLETFT